MKLKTPLTVVLSALALGLVTTAMQVTRSPNHVLYGETVAPCALQSEPRLWVTPTILGKDGRAGLEDMVRAVRQSRAIFVGEVHNRPEHHRAQLEIICRLHRAGADLAIGVEFFQEPFQAYLDDYIAGELAENDLLRLTDYDRRWGFDFKLYAPILRFARENRIPIVALNVPTELTKAVAAHGLLGISEAERALVPVDIDRSDTGYSERLKVVFDAHPKHAKAMFEHFLDAQLLWDEGMAENAADYLAAHPERKLVVLAGNGHVAWNSSIPARLTRRLDMATAVISQVTTGHSALPAANELNAVDFVLIHDEAAALLAGSVAPNAHSRM